MDYKNLKAVLVSIVFVTGLIVAGIIVVSLLQKKTVVSPQITPRTSTPPAIIVPTTNTSPTAQLEKTFNLAAKEPGTKLYVSEKLGIGFTYDPTPAEGQPVIVTESGQKIYVHHPNQKPEGGQWLEVFNKKPNETLAQAIDVGFLTGFNPANCFVKMYSASQMDSSIRKNYHYTGISYPPPTDTDAPDFQGAEKCPPVYTETNGFQYFMMNPAVPKKLVFVAMGQYSITSDGSPKKADGSQDSWEKSILIIK